MRLIVIVTNMIGGYAYLEYGFNTCGIANFNHHLQVSCELPVDKTPKLRTPIPTPTPKAAVVITNPNQNDNTNSIPNQSPPPIPKPMIIPTVPIREIPRDINNIIKPIKVGGDWW